MSEKNFTILGERCSGTKFLERLLTDNYNISVSWKYDWKHWFGFENYDINDDIIFIGIIRDPADWINSLWNSPHHVHSSLLTSKNAFLCNEWWSTEQNFCGNEVLKDRNFVTGQRYKNIFEHRKMKANYLMYEIPKKVKNYKLIRYEDLTKNPEKVTEKLAKLFNFERKGENYSIRTNEHSTYEPVFSKEEIYNHPELDKKTEKKLKYIN